MKLDCIDLLITLKAHRQAGASPLNKHTYTVLIDGKVEDSQTLMETEFNDSFLVELSLELEPGEHSLQVYYQNEERKGVLEVQNIYVAGEHGGVNLDSLLKREGYVNYGPNRTEKNKVGIWHHGSYWIKFNSPVFYWLLSKFPI